MSRFEASVLVHIITCVHIIICVHIMCTYVCTLNLIAHYHTTQVWSRMVTGIELLEAKRSRLAALSALSGLGDL